MPPQTQMTHPLNTPLIAGLSAAVLVVAVLAYTLGRRGLGQSRAEINSSLVAEAQARNHNAGRGGGGAKSGSLVAVEMHGNI